MTKTPGQEEAGKGNASSKIAGLKNKLGNVPMGMPGQKPPVFVGAKPSVTSLKGSMKIPVSPPPAAKKLASASIPGGDGGDGNNATETTETNNTSRRRVRGPSSKRRPSVKQRVYYSNSHDGFKVARPNIGADDLKREIIEKVDPEGNIEDYYLVAVNEEGVRRKIMNGDIKSLRANERLTLRKRHHSEVDNGEAEEAGACANDKKHDDKLRREDDTIRDGALVAKDATAGDCKADGDNDASRDYTNEERLAIRQSLQNSMLKVLDHPLLSQEDPQEEAGPTTSHPVPAQQGEDLSDATLQAMVAEVRQEMGSTTGGEGMPVFTPSPDTLAEVARLESLTREQSQTDHVNKKLLSMAACSIPQAKLDAISAKVGQDDDGAGDEGWEDETKAAGSKSDDDWVLVRVDAKAPAGRGKDGGEAGAFWEDAWAVCSGLMVASEGEHHRATVTTSMESTTTGQAPVEAAVSSPSPASASPLSTSVSNAVVEAIADHRVSEFEQAAGWGVAAEGAAREALAQMAAASAAQERIRAETEQIRAEAIKLAEAKLLEMEKAEKAAAEKAAAEKAAAEKAAAEKAAAEKAAAEKAAAKRKEEDAKVLKEMLEPKQLNREQIAQSKKNGKKALKGDSWFKNKFGMDCTIL